MVDFNHGKKALTIYKVIEMDNNRTRVHFFPLTGRTHQLRVHAAHALGLGTPIVGDTLYGKHDKRLLLHAEELSFTHPFTKQKINLICKADF